MSKEQHPTDADLHGVNRLMQSIARDYLAMLERREYEEAICGPEEEVFV